MARSPAASSALVRHGRRRIVGPLLACLLILGTAVAADAATLTNSWLAKVGSSGVNGTASITAFTTGTGSIALKLKKLPASKTLAVALLKTSCKGGTLLTLTSVKSASTGAATRTSSLTAAQVTAIKKATAGTGKIAIRVGTGTTAKCGLFAAQVVPAYVAARVTVGRSPSGVAIDATGVWVTNWWDNSLSRIDPVANTVLSVVPVAMTGNAGPESIVSGAGSLWITTSEFDTTGAPVPGSVLRIDPANGAVLATIPVGSGAYDITFGYGSVWVPVFTDGALKRIDPATNGVVATVPIISASGVAVDAHGVWVVDAIGSVFRIDPVTNTVISTIHTQATGGFIAAGSGSIWVTNQGTKGLGDGSVSRINSPTNDVIANIPVGDYPIDVSVSGGSV